MNLLEKWKKELKKLEKLKQAKEIEEKIPAVIKRCPKCYSLSLEFDPKTGCVRCSKCGFEVCFPKTGKAEQKAEL